MHFMWLGKCARNFVIRALYVDLAYFINGNLNFKQVFQVLRVTLHLALMSNYNRHSMYLFVRVQMSSWPLECRIQAKMV